jgi:pyrroline-5-carboxylate reductase
MGTRLAVIGGGNMGSAIVEGAVAAGVLAGPEVVVAEPDGRKWGVFERVGVRVVEDAGAALAMLDADGQVLVAVKPQMFAGLCAEVGAWAGWRGRVVVSIMAGVRTEKVRAGLGGGAKVVRAMPNTPVRLRRGLTAVCVGEGATEGDAAFCERLFGAVGEVVRAREELFDAFTAVAASGPAYVFHLAQAMAEAAEAVGFDPATALKLARVTVAGAGALLESSEQTPAELIAGVQSKGGTTEAAMNVLSRSGVRGAVVEAIIAARDRGRELGG